MFIIILLSVLLSLLIYIIVLSFKLRSNVVSISDKIQALNADSINSISSKAIRSIPIIVEKVKNVDLQKIADTIDVVHDRYIPLLDKTKTIEDKINSLCTNSVIQSTGICDNK